jgi:hypothetical protein
MCDGDGLRLVKRGVDAHEIAAFVLILPHHDVDAHGSPIGLRSEQSSTPTGDGDPSP